MLHNLHFPKTVLQCAVGEDMARAFHVQLKVRQIIFATYTTLT
jgi:hypothetical protein